ncbi:DUF4395 family protein [Grimontia sp. NTOU-MAR1]|uniref:DUF4395 family protein n=1 Tax=Grimontia sp. NTOU-MAR1 TaxID=3111011 RepID=UPI002DB9583F|nr:DUF4395 family protein [Grimontia sp. NTOU-MAR1]WRW01098.1 DUF4395 family protein [Grimontia sp. NTOU-MAR1]
MLSAVTMVFLLVRPEWDPVIYVGPYVIFDMIMAAMFGLIPLSPTGMLGTAMTMRFKAIWKPIKPKRFAWSLGAIMGITCLTFRLLEMPDIWLFAVLVSALC